jgi:hypothetical protein
VEQLRTHALAAQRVGEAESRLLRSREWALHLPGSGAPQLFAKPEDRWEVNNLYQQQIENAEELERILRASKFA